jgi:serine/threonine protein kinase
LTGELTQESAKIGIAQRVARLFAWQSVALTRRDRCGYAPCDRASRQAKIRSNDAHPIYEIASNHYLSVFFVPPMPSNAQTEMMPNPSPIVLKDRYELREILGEGGMGRVHRGYDRVLNRIVAVKVLTDVETPTMIERFEREAKTLSQLTHPNLAAIHDFGIEGKQSFIIMEFIEGKNLYHLITETNVIEPRKAMNLITQIGDGLTAAHEKGIVHRDIKPENIIVCQQAGKDWVEIVDFGIALSKKDVQADKRLTSTDHVIGTKRYMAPEQVDGKPATAVTDVYALGLVCAEMLAGENVITGGRLRSSLASEDSIARFWPVIEIACHEDPSDRWPSVRAMVDAFQQAAPDLFSTSTQFIPARPIARPPRGTRWKKRSLQWFSSAVALLSLCLAFFLVWRDYAKASPTPVVAIAEIKTAWVSKEELQIQVAGEIQQGHPHRMKLEIVACDPTGNRIPDKNSMLFDQSLGLLRPLDVTKSPPQHFLKTFNLRILPPVKRGYICVTVFDHDESLISQQNSAFWPDPHILDLK